MSTEDYSQKVQDISKTIDFEKNAYTCTIKTNMGDMHLKFYPDVAPNHCMNMIGLAKSGFYDGLSFHRIIKDFVIQGGCPDGNGTGGPGYHIDAEFNDRPHKLGTLSMARAADPNSGGSQFFVCLGDVPHLNGQYTVFGGCEDSDSLAVVEKIGMVETGPGDMPVSPITMESVTITETPL